MDLALVIAIFAVAIVATASYRAGRISGFRLGYGQAMAEIQVEAVRKIITGEMPNAIIRKRD